MTLVRIIKDWDYPDIIQQTPSGHGIWDGIQFTTEPVAECDYVIVCNRVSKTTSVVCPPQHIWAVIQEPPVAEYRWYRLGFKHYHRVYTQDTSLRGKRYVYSQPALPWHMLKSYDFLKQVAIPEKTGQLSWITSATLSHQGHQRRMDFLAQIQGKLEFDLWGRGFQPIKDKWDGLAPYKYVLAIENHRAPYYWSEKLADALLSWALPIYYGCKNIDDYFPADAIIKVDISKPAEAIAIIQQAIADKLWEQRLDVIAEARNRVLETYQFFPYFAREIRQWEQQHPSSPAELRVLPKMPYLYGDAHWRLYPARQFINRAKGKIRSLLT